jgi:GNAT superfamily N-acetyltransferase
MGIRLRLMTAKDIPEGMGLKDAAGWDQTAHDWLQFLRSSPKGCFVAEQEGGVVGTVATITYEDRFAWIGMVIVDKRYRGRGIGTTLLQHAVRYLDSRNIPTMKLDATPQGKPLYEKLGFVEEYDIERWMLKRAPRGNVRGNGPIDIEDVLSMDRNVFGADRGRLLRSLVEAAPDFVLVERSEEGIPGYVFGRHGSRADHLGPWVALGKDPAARLLHKFLGRSGRELIFVDCPADHPWSVKLVMAHGFEVERRLTRMFRGTNRYPGRPDLVCATTGPEFG